MASGEEDEGLAHFLEPAVLSKLSDQQEESVEEEDEDDREEEERDGKRLRVDEGELSEEEENERLEAKRIRIEEGEISDEGLSRALRSSSSCSSPLPSVELEAEVDSALLP